MITTSNRKAGGAAGRDAAIELLEARRQLYVNRCRRTALQLLLDGVDPITADDMRSIVTLPTELDARLIGAAILGLSGARIIRAAGVATSTRPERHAGILRTWELAGREDAETWLREHPDRPDPMPDEEERRRQMTLPGVA